MGENFIPLSTYREEVFYYREFPGGQVVKTQHFHCHGLGSIPGRGTKILHASLCGQKKKKIGI